MIPGAFLPAQRQAAVPTQGLGFMPANFQPHLQSRTQIQAAAPMPTREVIRGSAPDQNPITKFAMPSPEQLGVSMPAMESSSSVDVNWAMVHQRLRSAGSVSFQSDRTQSGFKFSCMIPAKNQGPAHRFESSAPSEHEAIQGMLKQVESWLSIQ